MVTLSNVNITPVSSRISSGDEGAPLDPPLTAAEIQAGGRPVQFMLVTATGDDGHNYQWIFTYGTSQADIQTSVTNWFSAGKPSTLTSPMLTAVDISPSPTWSV